MTTEEPNPLLDLVITVLTPMFLATTGGNITHARAAAAHTVATYNARNPADLLSIALAIALGLTALSSLSLSMAAELSVTMVLRLRGNAVSLYRAAEKTRLAEPAHPRTVQPPPPQPTPAPKPPIPPAQATERQQAWATAMTAAAHQVSAGIETLPPTERRQASMRAAALSSVAQQLLTQANPQPAFKVPRP